MDLPANERLRSPLALLCLILVGLALAVLVACGNEGEGGSTSPAAGSPAAQGGPGAVTVTSSTITGQTNKLMVILAAPEAGGAPLAQACVPITSDRFSAPSTVMVDMPAGQPPCTGSRSKIELPEGTYTVTASILVPPAQKAEVETKQTVRVSGDVTVKIDGAPLSR